MTDSTDVKLTVRKAVNEGNPGRSIALLPWRVIDRLNVPGKGKNSLPVEGYA